MKISKIPVMLFVTSLIFPSIALSHCQIPCGIYDDHAQVKMMAQDVATIQKAVAQIAALAGKQDAHSLNQITRWVLNKEKHAQNIIENISNYFLTQRLKPAQKDYVARLTKHHAVILAAMRVKQTADAKSVTVLDKAVSEIAPYYPEHKH